jgi:branched-subunit amino acid ABC-type transport system permease component
MNHWSFVVDVLSSAVIYALYALSVVLAYRTSRILMFCVGEVGMTSAYVLHDVWAWAGHGMAGLALAVIAAVLAGALIGWLLYAVLHRLAASGDNFTGTVITIAFSIFLGGVMSAVWSGNVEQLPFPHDSVMVGGISLSILSLWILLLGGGLIAALLLAFYRSTFGVELQALASNWQLSVLNGIPASRRLLAVWIAASAISAVAGILSAAISAVSIDGSLMGFSGIVAAIVGGLTSPGGAIVGALLLAAAENLTSFYFDARYSVAAPVALLVLLLVLRPSGLSARVESISRT